MKIALGADHRGLAYKEQIKAALEGQGHLVVDFGTHSTESVDYPDHAFPTANAVAKGECDRGILVCGSGIGMSIAANKLPGIRAAVCHSEATAEMSRQHNNANILCIGADIVRPEALDRILDTWMTTPYEGGRHDRRLNKIADLEAKR